MYPEKQAGGFTRLDGTVAFYSRINALIHPDMTVLDLGAGRGAQFEDAKSPYRRSLTMLKGKVKELVGADVDEAVLSNPFMDRTVVFGHDGKLPFADASFDMILSDWVIEHIEDPKAFAAEVYRILKPGGWFCARTPNKWGMTALGATLIPSSLHGFLLSRLTPERKEEDVFPKFYRMNTLGSIRKHFQSDSWNDASYIMNADPPYVQNVPGGPWLVELYWRLTPKVLHTVLLVFLQKKP